jgi:hypothetical protein
LLLLLGLTVMTLMRQYLVFRQRRQHHWYLGVDDTIGCGTPALFDAMRLIGSVLKIGAEESANDGPLL